MPPGSGREYRLAQLDDYRKLARRRFPHHSLRLQLDARASSAAIPGTWGFGLWNDSFALSLGGNGSGLRLPTLPNTAWYFHASAESYLTLRDDTPGQGFLVQVFRSTGFKARLLQAAALLAFWPRHARGLIGSHIAEETVGLDLNVTEWHHYELEWSPTGARFGVDGEEVLRTPVSPRAPLGIVIWIDNQYAALTPAGRIAFGLLPSRTDGWIEVRDVSAAQP